MGLSLFGRLAAAHPRAICALSTQYRMTADIMAISNVLVYGGLLRCGSEQQASARLQLPQPARLPPPAQDDALWAHARAWECAVSAPAGWSALPPVRHAHWLEACLDCERRVVFLDTDAVRLQPASHSPVDTVAAPWPPAQYG